MEQDNVLLAQDTTEVQPAEEAGDLSHPMDGLLDSDYGMTVPNRGEILEGTIERIGSTEILVDVGAKTEGVISGKELERMDEEVRKRLKPGDQLFVYVVSPEDKNGNIVLSYVRAQEEQDWREAEKLHETQNVYEGTVAGYNKGGLLVKVGKVRGFVPASQIGAARRRRSQGETPEERWGQMVGEPISVKVVEVDRARNRLILSERAAAREVRESQKDRLLGELKEGDERVGTVISLADFGAFVDLGGADGLIHLSELSYKRVNHPKELLTVGQKVHVQILNVDRERKRIGLSLKRLEEDPWKRIERKYRQGQLVEGTITKLAKFGAFARITGDEEIEGLIHISELSDGRINHPKEAVREGQKVTLRIIRIEADKRRLGLSLKRVDEPQYLDMDWSSEVPSPADESHPLRSRAEERSANRRAGKGKSQELDEEEDEYDDYEYDEDEDK